MNSLKTVSRGPKTLMRALLTLIFSQFIFLWFFSVASAQVPDFINYQSRLLDSGDTAITTGTDIVFNIYSVSTGGSTLWTESYTGGGCGQVTPDSDGYFNLQLGSCTSFPSTVDFTTDLYLGVTVGGDSEALPRAQLGTTPYAQTAAKVIGTEQSAIGTTTTADNAVLTVAATSTNSIAAVFQGIAGQIADIFQVLSAAGEELLTLTANGFLGIGTSTPTARLSVGGDAVVDGGLTVTGTSTLQADTTLVNATSTNFYVTTLGINAEYVTDLTGTGLVLNSGVLTVDTANLVVASSSFASTSATSTIALALQGFDQNDYLALTEWNATTTDALDEGSLNLYFTTARASTTALAVLAATTTDALVEGVSNFYYTETRFDTSIQGTSSLEHLSVGTSTVSLALDGFDQSDYLSIIAWNATTTDALDEGSVNRYWTDTRFDARLSATTSLANLATLEGLTTIGTSGATTTVGGDLVIDGSLSFSGTSSRDFTLTQGDPVLLGVYDPQDTNVFGNTRQMDVVGDYAYLTSLTNNGMTIVDVSDPGAPTTTAVYDPEDNSIVQTPMDVEVVGGYAYMTNDNSNNLVIIDVSDPSTPTTTGIWDLNNTSEADALFNIDVVGNYAYITDLVLSNLHIVDVSDRANPIRVGNWDPGDANVMATSYDVKVVGDYAYVAGLVSDNFAIVDISDPAAPTTVGNWDPNDTSVMEDTTAVDVAGKYAYVVGRTSDTMAVVDISDPSAPTTTAVWDPADDNVLDGARTVYVHGDYAYIPGLTSNTVVVVDISDPTNPMQAGLWDPNDTAVIDAPRDAVVANGKVYVPGITSNTLAILDLAVLKAPTADIGVLNASRADIEELRADTGVFSTGLNVDGSALIGGQLGVTGGITLASSTPATTTGALYQQASTLYWNGEEIGGDTTGTQWTVQSAGGDNDGWQEVTYGNGRYVAGGPASDRLMYSDDGVNWTTTTAAGDDDIWRGITYGNGRFVAVASSGDTPAIYSDDGITWSEGVVTGSGDDWYDVTYGNGRFVAVGITSDRTMYSDDGVNWTTVSAAGDNDSWLGITYGEGLFVATAVSGVDRVMYSSDGISWATTTAAGDDDSWEDVTYGNGTFVAVDDAGDRVMYSDDGVTWATTTAPASSWKGVAYGDGRFVAVGQSNERVMYSDDGVTWTTISAAGDNDFWTDVTYGNGQFVAVSALGDRVMTSGQSETLAFNDNTFQGNQIFRDTLTASLGVTIASGTSATTTDTLYQQGGRLYWDGEIIGATTTDALVEGVNNLYFTTARASTTAQAVLAATTTDALTEGSNNLYWTDARFDARLSATTSLANLAMLEGLTDIGVSGATTTVAGNLEVSEGISLASSTPTVTTDTLYNQDSILYWNGAKVGVSTAATEWQTQTAAGDNDGWLVITYGNGRYVAGGPASDRLMYSDDGVNWTTTTAAGDDDIWRGITYGNGRFVAVASSGDTPAIYSDDGITWSEGVVTGSGDDWYDVTYGNGRFVAVGITSDRTMYSDDGVNWTTVSAAGDNDSWLGITYGEGLFVATAVSGVDRVMYSSDGISWATTTAAGDDDSWEDVTYGNGTFVAVDDAGDRVMYSDDGVTWATTTAPASSWKGVAYGDGRFVAVGQSNERVMYSDDGVTWTTISAAGDNDFWNAIAYGNGQFVAVGALGDRVMTSGQSETLIFNDNTFQGNQIFRDTLTASLGMTIASGTPATTTSALYNQGNTLYWNGEEVGNNLAGIEGQTLVFNSAGEAAATSSIFVNTNGYVGIGSTTPETALQINDTVIDDASRVYDPNALMIVHQTPTSNTALNDPEEVLYLARQGTASQAFGALATFKLSRFENSGVESKTRLDLDLTDGNFVDNNVMTFLSNGNVGIGNSAPAAWLDIGDGVTDDVDLLRFSIDRAWTFAGVGSGATTQLHLHLDGADEKAFHISSENQTNSAAVFTPSNTADNARVTLVEDGGRVGVGTTSPNSELTVDGSVDISGALTLGGALGVNGETFTDLTGTGLTNAGGVLTLDATGDWTGTLDGQEGSYYLDADNLTNLDATDLALTNGYILRGGAGNQAEATSTLFITDTGNIGIGTTTPTSKLTVDGSIGVSDALVFGDGSTQPYAATIDAHSWNIETAINNGDSYDVPGFSFGRNAEDVFFSPDGTRMYAIESSDDEIFAFALSTPWDISTGVSAVNDDDFTSTAPDVRGMFIRSDGLKLYLVDYNGKDIVEYDLSTAWDITTHTEVAEFSVNTQTPVPVDVFFSPDGRKMYVTGDSGEEVVEYTLTTPWDVTTAGSAYELSIGVVNLPRATEFKPDGSRMYVIDTDDDIYEYHLTSPWDLSTAIQVRVRTDTGITDSYGMHFAPNGEVLFVGDGDDIERLNFGLNVDGNALFAGNVGIGTVSPTESLHILTDSSGANKEIALGTTGTDLAFFMDDSAGNLDRVILRQPDDDLYFGDIDDNNGNLYLRAGGVDEVTVLNGGNVGIGTTTPSHTLTVDGSVKTTGALVFGDGSTLTSGRSAAGFTGDVRSLKYVQEDNVVMSNPSGFSFDPTGQHLFVQETTSETFVAQYLASKPWDVSSLTFVASTTDSVTTSPRPMYVRQDGRKLYLGSFGTREVYEYDLSTPWDVTTLSLTSSSSLSEIGSFLGIYFKPDGRVMYVNDASADTIVQYNLSTPWDTTTATANPTEFDLSVIDTVPRGFTITPDGTTMLIIGSEVTDEIDQYTLLTPWDTNTATHTVSFNVNDQDTGMGGVFISSDQTKLYLSGGTSDEIYEYDMGLTAPSGILTIGGSIEIASAGAVTFGDGSTMSSAAAPSSLMGSVNSMTYVQQQDITEDATPNGVSFKPDGTKMYVVGGGLDEINEYDLSTPWDISTETFNDVMDITSLSGGSETAPQDMYMRSDGRKVYVAGFTLDEVHEYDLSTAWDITTLTHTNSFDFSAQTTDGAGITMSPDGRQLYVADFTTSIVYSYTLATAWDTSTAFLNTSIDLSSDSSNIGALASNDAGTVFYVGNHDTYDVDEYRLDVPWDISTMRFSASYYTVGDGGNNITGLYLRPDQQKLYVTAEGSTEDIMEYDLGLTAPSGVLTIGGSIEVSEMGALTFGDGTTRIGAFDNRHFNRNFGAASYIQTRSVATNPADVFFDRTGTRMFISTENGATERIQAYALSTPWDISTESSVGSFNLSNDDVRGLYIRGDGMKAYVARRGSDEMAEYDFSEPWDVTTMSFNQAIDISGDELTPGGLAMSPDGTKVFITGGTGQDVTQYDLGTAWDISTAVVRSGTLALASIGPTGIHVSPDGLELFVVDDGTDTVRHFILTTPWDVTTGVEQTAYDISAQDGTSFGVFVKPDGTKFYTTGTINDEVHEYDLGVKTPSSLAVEGQLAIGTTSPGSTLSLHVDGGPIQWNNGDHQIALTTPAGRTGIVFNGNEAGDYSRFNVANVPAVSTSDRVFIMGYNDSGGAALNITYDDDIGIGTTTPANRLHVYDTFDGLARFEGDDHAVLTVQGTNGSEKSVNFIDGDSVSSDLQWKVGLDNNNGAGDVDSFIIKQTNNTAPEFTIDTAGEVGIGVAAPAYELDVAGDINITGSYLTNGADYAEYFYTNDTDLEPGEIVCIDVTEDNAVERCTNPHDTNVMGIVSTKPAFLGNSTFAKQFDPHHVMVAMLGQIPAKVSTENGEIRAGDSLTSATEDGFAMKADAGDATVAIALEDFDGSTTTPETGTIQAMISRKNKSLTVSEVEQEVTERIAAMEIEDEVAIMLDEAITELDLDEDILAIVEEELQALDIATEVNSTLTIALRSLGLIDDETEISSTTASSTPEEVPGWMETIIDTMFDRIISFFADAANGIGDFFAGRVVVENEICVDGSCLTGDDVRTLLEIVEESQNAAVIEPVMPDPDPEPGDSTPDPDPTPDLIPDPEPDPIPTPDPDPVGTSTPPIADTLAPVITVIGGNEAITEGGTYTDLGATAADDIDGDISSNITTTGAVDTNTAGEYILEYNVSDAAGNAADTEVRVVTVEALPEPEPPAEDTGTSTPSS